MSQTWYKPQPPGWRSCTESIQPKQAVQYVNFDEVFLSFSDYPEKTKFQNKLKTGKTL